MLGGVLLMGFDGKRMASHRHITTLSDPVLRARGAALHLAEAAEALMPDPD